MTTKRVLTAAAAFLAITTLSIGTTQGRPPLAGPVSRQGNEKVINYKDLVRVPLPAADPRGSRQEPASRQERCAGKAELVGHDGVCPD